MDADKPYKCLSPSDDYFHHFHGQYHDLKRNYDSFAELATRVVLDYVLISSPLATSAAKILLAIDVTMKG